MKTIDLEYLRNHFDENGIPNALFDDSIRIALHDNIVVVFRTRGAKVQLTSFSTDKRHKRPRVEALELCNKWNQERISPKFFIDDDGDFIGEVTILADEEMSEEFVIENFIKFSLSGIMGFFDDLKG